ncbi:MAG: hypothetical protein K2J87_02240, partial [Muribaculaceae bacterium]|nr:hypothetical protein [Muribaculaceae bacterium]
QSGQMGQTVNLLVYTFGGSNPSSPTQTNTYNIRNAYEKGIRPDSFFSLSTISVGEVGIIAYNAHLAYPK